MSFSDVISTVYYPLVDQMNANTMCLLTRTSKEINKSIKYYGFISTLEYNYNYHSFFKFVTHINQHIRYLQYIIYKNSLNPHLWIPFYPPNLDLCNCNFTEPFKNDSLHKIKRLTLKNIDLISQVAVFDWSQFKNLETLVIIEDRYYNLNQIFQILENIDKCSSLRNLALLSANNIIINNDETITALSNIPYLKSFILSGYIDKIESLYLEEVLIYGNTYENNLGLKLKSKNIKFFSDGFGIFYKNDKSNYIENILAKVFGNKNNILEWNKRMMQSFGFHYDQLTPRIYLDKETKENLIMLTEDIDFICNKNDNNSYWYFKVQNYQYLIGYPDNDMMYNYDDPSENSDSESFIDYPEESDNDF